MLTLTFANKFRFAARTTLPWLIARRGVRTQQQQQQQQPQKSWEDIVRAGPPISNLDKDAIGLLRQRLNHAKAKGMPAHMNFTYPGNKRPSEAAVYLLLCTVNGKPSILFEERTRLLSSHSGEACFAGGKADKRDRSLAETAIREAIEELGIARSDVQMLGSLPPLPNKDYRIRVHPFVGVLRSDLDVTALPINKAEVHRAFALPLEHFYDPGKHSMMRFRDSGIPVPVFKTDKGALKIWGLTGFILHEFMRVIGDEAAGDGGDGWFEALIQWMITVNLMTLPFV